MGKVKTMVTEINHPITDEIVNLTEMSDHQLSGCMIECLSVTLEIQKNIAKLRLRKDEIENFVDLCRTQKEVSKNDN